MSYLEKQEVRVLLRQVRVLRIKKKRIIIAYLEISIYHHYEAMLYGMYQDPNFWKYRPLSELMVRAATDDVRFLLYIYNKMVVKMNQKSLWYLDVRGALYCRCFCITDNDYADWPPLPPIPGLFYLLSFFLCFLVLFYLEVAKCVASVAWMKGLNG